MKYFSVIVGEGCNAKCPFCIAPEPMKNSGVLTAEGLFNAHRIAQTLGIETISVSGGGEPMMLALKNRHVWNTLSSLAMQYKKRDLHSNYSFDLQKQGIDPLQVYNHVTVSLWPDAEINKAYMGYSRFNKTVELIERDAKRVDFRLSAILGLDWANSIDDLENYLHMALQLRVRAVTFRTFQEMPHEDLKWIGERYTDGKDLEASFAKKYPIKNKSLRDLRVYDYKGLQVMFYRYAREISQEDNEFLYYRPHSQTGEYDLFTDYSDDSKKFSALVSGKV